MYEPGTVIKNSKDYFTIATKDKALFIHIEKEF